MAEPHLQPCCLTRLGSSSRPHLMSSLPTQRKTSRRRCSKEPGGFASALKVLGDLTVPRECDKVFPSSYPGNGCCQSFHRLIYPPLNLQLLIFLHVQLDWWSVFLLLHVAPDLERVTGLSQAIPKRQRGAAVDKLKGRSSSSGSTTTTKSKRHLLSVKI